MPARGSVGVVLATKGRPLEASQVVALLAEQKLKPVVVVVDSSKEEAHSQLLSEVAEVRRRTGLDVRVVRADRASQPHQKNLGVAEILTFPDIRAVQFLDDDVSFDADFLHSCYAQLTEGCFLGVCPATESEPEPPASLHERLFNRLFLLAPGPPGRVTATGRNAGVSWSADADRPVRSEWLLGCSMYRRDVLERESFWSEQDGYVLFEDVEFSARVARMGDIAFLPWIRLGHLELSRTQPNHERQGYQMVVNRHRVVAALPAGSMTAFQWSVLGLLLRAGLGSVLGRGDARLRLKGTWRGLGDLLRARGPR